MIQPIVTGAGNTRLSASGGATPLVQQANE
jgi:hypothetical protein